MPFRTRLIGYGPGNENFEVTWMQGPEGFVVLHMSLKKDLKNCTGKKFQAKNSLMLQIL